VIPAQPNLGQYPISALYLFAVWLDRASFLAANGVQAPPFNPALPVKEWADASPSGQPYLAFDTTAGNTVELPLPASVADTVNLPGTYTYPTYADTPTDATLNWPYGVASPIDAATVCLEAEAQAIAKAIAFLFPGKTVTVVDASSVGVYYTVYHNDPRRQWGIEVNGVSPLGEGFVLYAKTLMLESYIGGVGAPGHWVYGPVSGEPVTTLYIQWVRDAQVTAAPAGAITLPVPIRPLLADESFKLIPPQDPMFGSAGAQWMVVRSDFALAVTLAQVQALVAEYNAQPGVAAIAIA
jgi:hypothetical protein